MTLIQLIDILEHEHESRLLFTPFSESAAWREFVGVSECAKQSIPPGDISVIKIMNVTSASPPARGEGDNRIGTGLANR